MLENKKGKFQIKKDLNNDFQNLERDAPHKNLTSRLDEISMECIQKIKNILHFSLPSTKACI